MNTITLVGNTVRDAEIREVGSSKVAKTTLAVRRPFAREGSQDTDFWPIEIWGKSGEAFNDNVPKGTKIAVTGSALLNTSGTGEDFKQFPVIRVDQWEFTGKKSDKPADAEAPSEAPANNDGFEPVSEDDLDWA